MSYLNNEEQATRKQLFQELRTLSDAMQFKIPTTNTYDLGGLQITTAFCNGHLLLLLWSFDGLKDTDISTHCHKNIVEHLGFLSGGSLTCTMAGREYVLNSPGAAVTIPANTPHIVHCSAQDGPCQGWAILVPPEMDLIPSQVERNASFCLLAKEGRCAGNPSDCIKQTFQNTEC